MARTLDTAKLEREFNRMPELEAMTRKILGTIHRNRHKYSSKPGWCLNWADMEQAHATLTVEENGNVFLGVDVSEASPDSTGLQNEVRKRLKDAGFDVWVTSSW